MLHLLNFFLKNFGLIGYLQYLCGWKKNKEE